MIQEEKPLKAGKKLLALLLTVCMLLCMLPTVAFASGSDYLKIAMLDSGRKYFSADWVKAFLYEAKADGYTHVMLAVGNDGMRFLLDDMSLTVGGKTYSSNAVASAIRAGNNAYTTASSGEWTESEMDEFFATAKKAGIEIIPLLNSPGHMDSVLYAASSLTGTNCSYNGSSRTIDVTNDTAVRFSQAFLQKYVDYFAGKGCRYFNFGADEYANDRYTSGSMGFGSLQNSGKYGYFIKYVNELAAMIKQAGMTPIAFNDGIEFANKMSASVGSTTYTFDRDIVVCYWSGGWSGYTLRTAANLASDGFRIINTTGDFYYVLGKNDSFDNGYTYAANWSNYKVCGTSLSASSVIGGMFCMWSDYPGAETQTQEAKKIRLPLRAMGLAMDGAYTSGMDTSVVPGGFNADGSINTDPPAQSHDYRQTASTAATCTEAGSVTYTCADCGDSYTETVPALGHNYAAADDAGDTIYTCTRCGEQHSELLPREYVSVKTGKTTEAYTLDGEQSFTHTGDDAIARGELTVVQGTGTKVSYSASASASVPGYTDGGYNCVASNLIDGDTSTYYWSTSCQTSGMYARVDLGAEVRFDAVQISAPAHGDYCTNANVQLSSDGRTWTTIGTFTSSRSTAVTKTYAVPSSVESFRYIQVALTTARNYWWQLSEIAWGSYDGATFTRAAASGTVQTGTAPMTEVRFTGVAAGTTYYVIGGTRYVIEVEADHVHSYQEVSRTAATCTEDGSKTVVCEDCGETLSTEVIPATGHSFGDWTVTKEATCFEDGEETRTCSVCQAVETRPIFANSDNCPSKAFTDLDAKAWYHEGVDYALTNGLMNGVGGGKFEPDGQLTRAQLVTVLYRAAGEPDTGKQVNPFTDVADDAWYTKAVIWAANNGIVNGVAKNTFAPDDSITREQIATMLYRYAGAEAAKEDKLSAFPDAAKVSDWAKEALNWAVASGLINGVADANGTANLEPQATATRAQIATILMRWLEK